jgi:hypothetical protein
VVNNPVQTQEKSNLIVPLVIVFALLPVIGLGWWWLSREPAKNEAPAISAEAKEYVRSGSLGLSGVEMKATANFTGAAVIEITGNITNQGTRPLDRVELNCIFYDTVGQVVLRERVPIVRRRVNPGETASFRLPFEGLPDSWNKQMPQLVIANIVFGQ